MSNKVFYSLMAFLSIGMIALAMVWPQGLGSRSPAPFGHAIVEPDFVRMQREKAVREAQHKTEQITKGEIKTRERAEREEAQRAASRPMSE